MEEISMENFLRKKRNKKKVHWRNCCRNLSEKGKEKKKNLEEYYKKLKTKVFIFLISL